MKLRTRILSLTVAALTATATIVSAAPSWKFAGYDLSKGNPYAILEYEVDEKGLPTGNTRANGYASKVEWKHDFYEAIFPHKGYDRLYLDGTAQNLYSQSANADSEQEWRPIYWEAKTPYPVYDLMYSRIPGVMDWTAQPAPDFVKFGNRNANVSKVWVPYGFSAYKTTNGMVVDTHDFLNALGASRFSYSNVLSDVNTSYNYLWSISGIVQQPGFEISNYIAKIPVIDQENLIGPKYDGGKEAGTTTVCALDNIVEDFSTANWYNDTLLTNDTRDAEVEWVYAGYEKDGDYRMYEIASIDGVLMDGGACSKLVYNPVWDDWYLMPSVKPYIARYTGGNANPDVVWKAVWPELSYPYSVYERKMVKDNSGTMVWTDEYRPSGEYAKILPSFIITSSNPGTANRELKLTLTSNILPDFDIGTLVGTNYSFVDEDGNVKVVVFNGNEVPAFQNTVVTNNARF